MSYNTKVTECLVAAQMPIVSKLKKNKLGKNSMPKCSSCSEKGGWSVGCKCLEKFHKL